MFFKTYTSSASRTVQAQAASGASAANAQCILDHRSLIVVEPPS